MVLSSLWAGFCSAIFWCKWSEGKYPQLCVQHTESLCHTFFFTFLQPFKNVNTILSSWAVKKNKNQKRKTDGMLNLAHGLLLASIKGPGRQHAWEMCPGRRTRERGGNQECPTSGPSGLGCPVPCDPTPTPAPVHPHAPAVHNDGAGAAPVALVHFPATRSGCEGGHQHTPGGCFFFLFSPCAQGRGGKRAGEMSQGRRQRTRMMWVALGLPCHLMSLMPKGRTWEQQTWPH